MAFVLAVRVGPADVGRRVTLRHLDPQDGRPSDVVGVLEDWAGGVLTLRRRDGRRVRVDAAGLRGGKVVAPELGAYDVQALAEAGWPAQDRAEVGAWVGRWDHGVTRRANSALVTCSVPDLRAQLAQVSDWYAARGAPAVLSLPDPWPDDDLLDGLGWRREAPTDVLTAPTADLLRAAAPVRVALSDAPPPGWLAAVDRFSARDQQVLGRILTRAPVVAFASAQLGDDLVGIGRASIDTRSGARWACLTNLNTAPSARRRGVARAVTAALAGWAATHGATTTYLQVEADNAAARRLYDTLGFTPHHRYAYRVAPPGGTA